MNTRVRRKPLGEQREPHPNALSVIQHVQQYLAGACNQDAVDNWLLAVARSIELGQALDAFLEDAAGMFIGEYGLPGKGRHAKPVEPGETAS